MTKRMQLYQGRMHKKKLQTSARIIWKLKLKKKRFKRLNLHVFPLYPLLEKIIYLRKKKAFRSPSMSQANSQQQKYSNAPYKLHAWRPQSASLSISSWRIGRILSIYIYIYNLSCIQLKMANRYTGWRMWRIIKQERM